MSSIKLLQLNIEKDKHLDKIEPFLQGQDISVACFEEVPETLVNPLAEAMRAPHFSFFPTLRSKGIPEGLMIASTHPLKDIKSYHYAGDPVLHDHIKGSAYPEVGTFMRAALFATVAAPSASFRIGATHFTWTPDGSVTDEQRKHLEQLFAALSEEPEFILCGDFNAPRGGETWERIAARYRDTIPQEITSSLDGSLHRAGELPYVVDGIFSTPHYSVTNVERHCGISDHCGFTAMVGRESV
jgi:endonuclease/exonuclease/phosphatase family metal-dependent hydrolase